MAVSRTRSPAPALIADADARHGQRVSSGELQQPAPAARASPGSLSSRSISVGIGSRAAAARWPATRARCFSIHACSLSANAAASRFDPHRGTVMRTRPSSSTRIRYRRARGCRTKTGSGMGLGVGVGARVSGWGSGSARGSAGSEVGARDAWRTVRAEDPAASVTAVDRVAAFAKAVGQVRLHLQRLGVRHRVEVLVEPRHEAFAAAPDDARGLEAAACDSESAVRARGRSCRRNSRLCRRPSGCAERRRRRCGDQTFWTSSSSTSWNGSPPVSSGACSMRGMRSIGSRVLISSPPLAACSSLNGAP